MNSPTTLFVLLASSAAVLAQSPDPQRVAGFDNPASIVWEQETNHDLGIVQYDERHGERTLMFAHVTIDENVAGTVVAAGLASALPFLVSPLTANWTLNDGAFTALPSSYRFSGENPMVPPRRMANHLVAYNLASNQGDYGTTNNLTSGFVTHETAPGMVVAPTSPIDERSAWANLAWTSANMNNSFQGFDTAMLGSGAVMQSAQEYLAAIGGGPISVPAINFLNELMAEKLGFVIFVQAAHVSTTEGEVEVRVSRSSRIRRRSLLEASRWPFGPSRSVPMPTNSAVNIYLAPRGDFLHLEFPVDVGTLANPTTLRAYVPTTNGLVLVDQVANPTYGVGDEEELLKPHVGLFPCPSNAITGTLYIEQVSNPGARFAPLGHYGYAAKISAYNIPPGPIVPPATPPEPL